MEFKIRLRAFKLGDEVLINKLREDEEMERNIGGMKRFVSPDREAKWVHDIIMGDNPKCFYTAITELDSDDIIGYISIVDIDYRSGTCVGAGIKMSREASRKGYGRQAELLMVKYIFEELRMVRLSLYIPEHNIMSLNTALKAGFVKEGLLRKNNFKNGKHVNEWLVAMTDEDYAVTKEKYNL